MRAKPNTIQKLATREALYLASDQYYQDIFEIKQHQFEYILADYSARAPKVEHGAFIGQLPRQLREINFLLAQMKNNEITFRDGMPRVAFLAQTMGREHPLFIAAKKLNGITQMQSRQAKNHLFVTARLNAFLTTDASVNLDAWSREARSNPEIAAILLTNSDLRQQFFGFAKDPFVIYCTLKKIALSHPQSAALILNTADLRNTLFGTARNRLNITWALDQIAEANAQNALLILKSDALLARLYGTLSTSTTNSDKIKTLSHIASYHVNSKEVQALCSELSDALDEKKKQVVPYQSRDKKPVTMRLNISMSQISRALAGSNMHPEKLLSITMPAPEETRLITYDNAQAAFNASQVLFAQGSATAAKNDVTVANPDEGFEVVSEKGIGEEMEAGFEVVEKAPEKARCVIM